MVDAEFRSSLSSASLRLASGEISTSDDTFSSLLRAHLERFDLGEALSGKGCQRRTRRIERAVEQLGWRRTCPGNSEDKTPLVLTTW